MTCAQWDSTVLEPTDDEMDDTYSSLSDGVCVCVCVTWEEDHWTVSIHLTLTSSIGGKPHSLP